VVTKHKHQLHPRMEAKVSQVKEIKFKKYDQEQVMQVPIAVSSLIPIGHLVRIVNQVVEGIEMSDLEQYYQGGGRSPYNPKMLIKVWIYGYCERLYTSRRLAKALRENIHFMWLSGSQQPCFKTLCEFRGERMQAMIDVIFKQVLLLLVESGYIDLGDLYLDGSKWAANANQYKRVWRTNTERYKQAVTDRIVTLLEEIKALQAEEDSDHGQGDLRELGKGEPITVVLNSEEVKQHLVALRELVEQESAKQQAANKSKIKDLSRLSNKLAKEQENLIKYEEQEAVLGERNSYSQTDHDATMLRMKDDRLLPAYNVQHTTSNQYIVNYTIAQNGSDSPTLPPHLDKMEVRFEGLQIPEETSLGADAGYGSEENYADLESRGIEAYVKYPLWYQEVSGELVKKRFRRENWDYDAQSDTYTCPEQRTLVFKQEEQRVSENGYEKTVRIYECESCENCPLAAECKKSETKNRTVMHSEKGEAYKAKAKELLETDRGEEVRSNRAIEVESTFGDIKYNMKHDRFVLRGSNKVYVEYGLLSIGHNLRKVYCKESGIWAAYYAQRASKKGKKILKRA
jgi:transposase